jgi:putative transposase
MSKRTVKHYSSEFKVKVVLELLKEDQTLNQLASKYGIFPGSLINWKKQFLENAELAFNKEQVIKEYKQKLCHKELENEQLYNEIGKLTTQLSWAEKKIKGSQDIRKNDTYRSTK